MTESTNLIDECRTQFENWAIKEGRKVSTVHNPLLNREDYNHVGTAIAWTGWKAAWGARNGSN